MISDDGVRYSIQCRYRPTHLEGVLLVVKGGGLVEQWTVSKAAHNRETVLSFAGPTVAIGSPKRAGESRGSKDAFATDLSSKPTSTRRHLELGQPAQRPWPPP